jgi:uncharacterized protein
LINLVSIKHISRAKKYPRNTIFGKDKTTCGMVFVLKGEVGVFNNYHMNNEAMTSVIGPGGFFGETALFLEKGTPDNMVALTDVIGLPVESNGAVPFIRDEPELTFELIKELCARLYGAGSEAQEPEPAHPAPAAAPPAAQSPVPPAAAAKQARQQDTALSIFPEGHGSYQLPLINQGNTYVMKRGYSCPLCKKEFTTFSVRSSRLVQESTDSDMRHRYRGVEPLYYDVVTCPECLYSALGDQFGKPDSKKADLAELQALKSATSGMFGTNLDASSVFAGYYLALLCAPKCFTGHRLATAKLLVKLSRVYQDCGDKAMEEKTAQRALDAYLYIYLNEQSEPAQDQQLCIIIGELYLKLNDLRNAREYFFKAKTNRGGTPLLKNHAENRILAIRTMEEKG